VIRSYGPLAYIVALVLVSVVVGAPTIPAVVDLLLTGEPPR
jgi:uncharacterized membrane protein YdjX (TVP38/TMEM64 family)